jgi:hypothetical protein
MTERRQYTYNVSNLRVWTKVLLGTVLMKFKDNRLDRQIKNVLYFNILCILQHNHEGQLYLYNAKVNPSIHLQRF